MGRVNGNTVAFVNTVRVLFPPFALIKSILPSPLTSAAVTELGPLPTTGEEESLKETWAFKAKLKAQNTISVWMVFIISTGEHLRAGGDHRRDKDEHFHVHEFFVSIFIGNFCSNVPLIHRQLESCK
jgi:hypothetical protein